MTNKLTSRNGRMTRRAILRSMSNRAFSGEASESYAISYVARRIGYSVDVARRFIMANVRLGVVDAAIGDHVVIFN